jgi:signal transduction histidine kinase
MRSLDTVWMVASARVWLLAVTAGSTLALALGFVHPPASYDPTLRTSAETAIALCALTATWLLSAQFAYSRKLRDLLLFAGLLTLAFLHLFSYALPAVGNLNAGSSFAAALLCGNVFAGATFAAAALAPSDRVFPSGGGPRAIAAGLGVLAVGLAELGGLLLHNQLVPAATHPVEGIGSALGHPLGVVLVLVAAGLFGVAAVAFARRAQTEQPRIITQLAGASVLLAAAGLYSLALPALPPNWVAPGLGLRLVAWVLVFIAVVGRELDVRAGLGLAAVTAERRRVAGNLHDGLAQDLAFIVAHRTLLSAHLGAEHPLTVAASRALAVSRAAITELWDSSASTVHEALESVAHELSHRFEVGVALDAHLDAELAPDMREHVVRIVREAIVNAARHGDAKHVSVSLRRTGEGVVLRVRDDGCGIAHAATDGAREGFGLRSMCERAAVRGGRLVLSEPANGGTELEVLFPRPPS